MLTPGRPTRAEIAHSFVTFASHCRPGSPLYAELAAQVPGDEALLTLAARTRPGQPPANMLLGAVHYLLLRGARHPLARHYPSLGGALPPGPEAFAALRDFCRSHDEELSALLATRLTQTNETRRCAYLLPAFAAVQARAGGRPLALLEIGPSAGLNLNFDRYRYDYGEGLAGGDQGAHMVIGAELRGPLRPPIPAAPPAVAWRCGVDLNPVDLDAPDQVAWLEALIWPEQRARLERLRAAVALARAHRPPIVAGDALELLPGLIAQAPAGAALCVYHTHVIYQFSPAMRAQLDAILEAAGRERPLDRVGCEGFGAEHPRLTLTHYGAAGAEERLLAIASGHGNWLEWRDEGCGA